ncbi:hypothetical protein [Polyangium sp. 6x1]|uniref:hypothetical protein n=1 Tax=Polyangium sp. 6x1 TaxID=3042689 RepID=UPI002482E6F2|nr:hypothetical protein [Polyangium sp. 6x1]MDI1450015.1 hypothetical protein [Polyangium sp. 6x1]
MNIKGLFRTVAIMALPTAALAIGPSTEAKTSFEIEAKAETSAIMDSATRASAWTCSDTCGDQRFCCTNGTSKWCCPNGTYCVDTNQGCAR